MGFFFFFFPSFPLPPTSLQPSKLQGFCSAAKCLFSMEKVLMQSVVVSPPGQGLWLFIFYFNNISKRKRDALNKKGFAQRLGIAKSSSMRTHEYPRHTLPSQELVGPSRTPIKSGIGSFFIQIPSGILKSQRVSPNRPAGQGPYFSGRGRSTQRQNATRTGMFSCVMSFYLKSTFIQQ